MPEPISASPEKNHASRRPTTTPNWPKRWTPTPRGFRLASTCDLTDGDDLGASSPTRPPADPYDWLARIAGDPKRRPPLERHPVRQPRHRPGREHAVARGRHADREPRSLDTERQLLQRQ